MTIEDLKKSLKENKLIFGADRTLKLLKNGKVSKIFLSSNCAPEIRENLKHLAKISNVNVTELKETKEEIGSVCKKSFSISIACY
jgi:ribosomal protein L30E